MQALLPDELTPEGYQHLAQAFEQSCQKYSSRAAYSCLGQTISYAELEKLSRNFA